MDQVVKEIPVLDIDHVTIGGYIRNTLAVDKNETREDALFDIYRVMRPGEPPTLETAEAMFNSLFFGGTLSNGIVAVKDKEVTATDVARVIDARGEGKQAIVVGVARTTLAETVSTPSGLRLVLGIGLAAMRDVVSFFRYEAADLASTAIATDSRAETWIAAATCVS